LTNKKVSAKKLEIIIFSFIFSDHEKKKKKKTKMKKTRTIQRTILEFFPPIAVPVCNSCHHKYRRRSERLRQMLLTKYYASEMRQIRPPIRKQKTPNYKQTKMNEIFPKKLNK
jgi:hypothetical protein